MMAPHTSSLAFSFLACACALLELLRTRQILLFLFWRVHVPCWGVLRTRQILLFLFWRVPVPYWGWLRTRQILLFLFWRVPVPCWEWLRTRQVLLFLFWRVLVPCWGCSAHAKSCFFFSGVCLLSSTSSASQPPHSYLRASIGSMRAALFAG